MGRSTMILDKNRGSDADKLSSGLRSDRRGSQIAYDGPGDVRRVFLNIRERVLWHPMVNPFRGNFSQQRRRDVCNVRRAPSGAEA